MILYGNARQDRYDIARSCFDDRQAVAGPAPTPGPIDARPGRAHLGLGGRAGSTMRQGGMPMRHRRTARAIHLRGPAQSGGPHPNRLRAGGSAADAVRAGAVLSARVRDALEAISAINVELLSRGALG